MERLRYTDIAIAQPTKFDLVVNLKTAKTLDLPSRPSCSLPPAR
jgi:hypothetical protein